MEAQRIDPSAQPSWPAPELYKWRGILASACDAIRGTPPSLMTSVTVTGRLDGVEGESKLVMMMSEQLAAEHNLRATFKQEGSAFTVQFSRKEGSSAGRSVRK